MLPLVAGLFWSVNSQLAACENKGESIVATYFSLELLYSSSDNGGVRDRRQGETKGAQRDPERPRDNQNTKLRVSNPTLGSNTTTIHERLRPLSRGGPTPANPEIIIMEY